MNVFKLYLLVPGAVLVSVLVGLVWLNTAGVSYLEAAHVEFPAISLGTQTPVTTQPATQPPVVAQPAQPPQDNTALWIALISSLVLSFFNTLNGMFNTYMQYLTKRDINDNTAITQQTKAAVKESLADRSNH